MIRALLRPLVIPRLRRARQAAVRALEEAERRRDTRAVHAARKRLRQITHDLMRAES
jgi:hypothetical protein